MSKGFFDMTRRERRGTVVLLALMAVLLLVTALVRMKKSTTPASSAAQTAVEAFEAEADSVIITVDKPLRHKAEKKKSNKRHAAKKPKPADKPRRLDSVPQF